MIDDALEQAYNVREVTPGSAAKVDALAERGAQARNRLADAGVQLTQARYGEGDRETIDLFTPAGQADGPRQCLLFIHGGYWRSLTKEEYSWIAEPFVARGWVTAIMEYALVPAVTIAKIVDQTRRAYRWLADETQTDTFAIDAERITVAGHSAGGHLAVAALLTDINGARPERKPCHVVSVSGLFDLRPLPATSMNDDLRLSAQDALALSPQLHIGMVGVPVTIAVGDAEPAGFLEQHDRFVARLSHVGGIAARQVQLSDADHFDACDRVVEPDGPLLRAILDQPL